MQICFEHFKFNIVFQAEARKFNQEINKSVEQGSIFVLFLGGVCFPKVSLYSFQFNVIMCKPTGSQFIATKSFCSV